MWIWQECEEYVSSTGETKVVDDWGAAAHRYLELASGASAVYALDVGKSSSWILTVRCRCLQDAAGALKVCCGGFTSSVELKPAGRKGWRWVSVSAAATSGVCEVRISAEHGICQVDGFFLHDEPVELPDDVRELDPMLGESEAAEAVQGCWRETQVPGGVTPRFEPSLKFPSDIAREEAGDLWPVLQLLAVKPCPYIVNAYDTGKDTDYNSDYSWHALDKEKRWELAWSGALGLVNPNSDISYVIGFAFDTDPVTYDLNFRPILHLVDVLTCEVDLDPALRCEVTFRSHNSNTVVTTVHIANQGGEERRVVVGELLGKDNLENPPYQRYVLPGQLHGSGVTTTAGGLAWIGMEPDGKAAAACFYEWVRGRSRGRRLLTTLVSAQKGNKYPLDPHMEEQAPPPPGAILGLKHPVIVPAGETVVLALALNMRRFTLHDTWNPEITPKLYKFESEEAAQEAAYFSCEEAISGDIRTAIERSIEPYRTFPRATLPEKNWQTDFYACLELPRASTFSPLGSLETPFYNFCRVHAHEPFNWWSYGMHAHEDLCTLFTNITNPGLSANFLLGHIRHQREDGMYPYGVSHNINPRLTTKEATAPLIVWEAWMSYLWSGDREFLREVFESGKRSHEWWLRTRDRCGEGLCHWLNTSGESVRDDDGLPTWQATGGGQYQEALDLNCYLLVQERTLSEMARELGLPEEMQRYQALAEHRTKVMNVYMWHEKDRCYYGIGEVAPAWADVKDISTFFPLWAKLAPDGRFESLVSLIDDPDTFGLPYGPPTLAKNEPCFGPQKHWYGSNWVEMSLFPILGLRNYGFYQRSAGLAHQNTKMVFDELERYGHFREYFNSIEGNGTDLIDYIWTAMPAFFIVNVFFGIQPQADGLLIMPALPNGWNDIEISDLRVRGKRISVKVSRDPSVSSATVMVDGEPVEAGLGRGTFLPWDRLREHTWIRITQPSSIPETHSAPPEAAAEWSDVPPHSYPIEERQSNKPHGAAKMQFSRERAHFYNVLDKGWRHNVTGMNR